MVTIQLLRQIAIHATRQIIAVLRIRIMDLCLFQPFAHNAIQQIRDGNLQHILSMTPSSRSIQEDTRVSGLPARTAILILPIMPCLIVKHAMRMCIAVRIIQMHSVIVVIPGEHQNNKGL